MSQKRRLLRCAPWLFTKIILSVGFSMEVGFTIQSFKAPDTIKLVKDLETFSEACFGSYSPLPQEARVLSWAIWSVHTTQGQIGKQRHVTPLFLLLRLY